MRTFPHVFEPDGKAILHSDFHMKGNWKKGFFGNEHPLVLEVGCGRGEYTVQLGSRFPRENYIGIDIKGARMWKGARESLDLGLTNVAFLRTRVEFLERIFAPGEVDEIWVTFPDPQPQKPRKRLTSARFLNRYAKYLKPGGRVHLKSDSLIMYRYTSEVLRINGIEPEIVTPDLYTSGLADEILSIRTHYESGYILKGKPITYTRFRLEGDKILEEPADQEDNA